MLAAFVGLVYPFRFPHLVDGAPAVARSPRRLRLPTPPPPPDDTGAVARLVADSYPTVTYGYAVVVIYIPGSYAFYTRYIGMR